MFIAFTEKLNLIFHNLEVICHKRAGAQHTVYVWAKLRLR